VTLAPEERLLLECARTEIDAEGTRRAAALLRPTLDWQYVLDASIRHGVAPLLRDGLDQIGDLEGVPGWFIDRLTELHRGSAARNARLFAILEEILVAMRREGVDPVGLKDIQLAVDVYSRPAQRPMGDVDLLVRQSDWDAASRALVRLGFLPRPAADVPYTRRYAMAQHFRRATDEIWIDLQWNVLQREWDMFGEGTFVYDGAEMWSRAATMDAGGFEIRVPKLEDMLFHLCLHLEGHLYCELILFCDIAELLRRRGDEVDWDELVALTRRYRAEASVYYVLLLTRQLLGVGPPEHVLAALRPRSFKGALFMPVFGNLTSLHLSLDEMRLAASPPRQVLDDLELVARRQAARAMQLHRELDGLAHAFLDVGARLLLWDGTRPPRVFPDTALAPFGSLEAFVLASDRACLDAALSHRGFDRSRKECGIVSRDPVLAGRTTRLALTVEASTDLSRSLSDAPPGPSNAAAALRSLRARARRGAVDDAQASARLVVHLLAPEELAVVLAARAGRARTDRLFRLVSLLELLSRLPAPLDGLRLAEVARIQGVEREVAGGLRAVGAVVDSPRADLEDALARLGDVTPRLLEWARYGPSSLRRFPWLRDAYYFVFCVVSLASRRERARYLLRSIVGSDGVRPVLPGIVLAVARGAVRSLQRPRSTRELAYWIEPATLARLGGPRRDALPPDTRTPRPLGAACVASIVTLVRTLRCPSRPPAAGRSRLGREGDTGSS
jgi:hypothetical protein